MRSKFGRSKRHRNFGTNSESTGISSIIGVRGKGKTGRFDDKEKSSPSKRKHKQVCRFKVFKRIKMYLIKFLLKFI